MNLVLKENLRGQFFKRLSISEKEAVFQVFSSGRKPSRADILIVEEIISDMERHDLLIECDCIAKTPEIKGPYNGVVNRDGKYIRHLPTSAQHEEECPLFRVKKSKNIVNGNKEGKISSMNPVGCNDWLPEIKDVTEVRSTGESGKKLTHRGTILKPVPALGRKLLTVLQAAGVHQRELIPSYQPPGTSEAIKSITEVLNKNQMGKGVLLSDVLICAPWLSVKQITVMMSKLENNLALAGIKKEACIYIIGIAGQVTNEEVKFTINKKDYPHNPTARIKINGESTYNAGSRAPYWVIVEYRRDKNSKVYCHSGYAHSAYSANDPIPVDSNQEKKTLDTIISASRYASTQKNCPETASLNKPLFSMMSRVDDADVPIHPDFIIKVSQAGGTNMKTLIIETMGSESDDYINRKARMHNMMKEEGLLITDPAGWPTKDSKENFNTLLLSNLF